MDRRDRILANLRLDGLGLEIGPSIGPVAAGTPGLRVRTLDHLDQAGLIAKYTKMGVDTSNIRPVDYVWSGQSYRELVGDTRFDWIIASHVIEHVPDLVGFLAQCAEILVDDGVLSLVVPDKRRCFDHYRPPSSLGSIIDASLAQRVRPTAGHAAEFVLNFAKLNGKEIWMNGEPGAPHLQSEAAAARNLMNRVERGEYADIHNWVFTPNSFRLVMHDLAALDLTPLRELRFEDSDAWEFYIQLSKRGEGPPLTRHELCAAALADLEAPRRPERPSETHDAVAALSALGAENRQRGLRPNNCAAPPPGASPRRCGP